jgi:hypothetical protein
MKTWISGRPAPFATAGECAWKEAIAAQIHASVVEHSGGMVLDFTLRDDQGWPGHPDIDNLCEPVFSTFINRLGWFGGSRTNLGWYPATKRPGADVGALISIATDPAPEVASVVMAPRFATTWSGSLPSSARAAQFLAWVRAEGASVTTSQLRTLPDRRGPAVT